MKRTLAALGVGLAVFGGLYGFSASLGVNASSLGAGTSVVAACQATPVDVSYATSYSATGYQATTVTVGGLNTATAACGGKSLKVALTGASGLLGSEATATVPLVGTSVDVTLSGISAADVTGVQVSIAG